MVTSLKYRLLRMMRQMADCRSGSVAIEYALIALLVAIGIFASVQALGVELNNLLNGVALAFPGAK